MESFESFIRNRRTCINGHFLNVDLFELASESPEVFKILLARPAEIEVDMKKCAQKVLASEIEEEIVSNKDIEIRFFNFPSIPGCSMHTVPKCDTLGHLIAMTGVVTKLSGCKMHESERLFECTKCHSVQVCYYDLCINDFNKPAKCTGNKRDGSICNSTTFGIQAQTADFVDYQELRIQECLDRMNYERVPRSLTVVVEKDLVDAAKPGDKVTVIGSVKCRMKKLNRGERCQGEQFILANNVITLNNIRSRKQDFGRFVQEFQLFHSNHAENPVEGLNEIIMKVAPKLYGLDILKLATLLACIGGISSSDENTKVRGDSHILFVGDPGTGKSELLKFASKLVQKSVSTTGIGSTTAGLTCSAAKDGAEWVLEAGALVLADNGMCCIDEFSSIRENDKTAIHEAMEQQTISVAKAGLVCKLKTRCSILAASNPKGNYDQNQSLEVNLALGSPILSRFDLIFIIIDRKDKYLDQEISSYILKEADFEGNCDVTTPTDSWSMDKLTAYVEYCKQFKPKLDECSEMILTRYYQHQRKTDHLRSARTTIRLLESLIRLAQAHARLMCHETISKHDALVAVCLMECSVLNSGLIAPNIFGDLIYFSQSVDKLSSAFV